MRTSGDEARVAVAQIGARRHYAVPIALHRVGALSHLITDACANTLPWQDIWRSLPAKAQPDRLQRLLGRWVSEIPLRRIQCLHAFFLYSQIGGGRQHRGEPRTDYWARQNEKFCRAVCRVGFAEATTVYAFNGAALEIFQAAHQQGLKTVLDQTAAPWRHNASLLLEEAERWPDWELRLDEVDRSGRLSEREEQEWALSDRIICGSNYVAETLSLSGHIAERCKVVSYGFDFAPFERMPPRSPSARRLRVLFVGALQLRKGLPYLMEAKRFLGEAPVEIRLVGQPLLSEKALRKLANTMEIVGQVARADMAKQYAWADIFVFPSLSEGSANVCYEALACGLPVITTPNAGSVVRDGEDGFIVPIRDAQALADRMLLLHCDRKRIRDMSAKAVNHAREFSNETYGCNLANAIAAS